MDNSRFFSFTKWFTLFITIQLFLDSTSAQSGVTEAELKAIREDGLKWHNIFRTWHRNTPPMTLDDKLNNDAQKYAEVLAKNGQFDHDMTPNLQQGENLFSSSLKVSNNEEVDATHTGVNSTKSWWQEFCETDAFPRGSFNHFTQLVWKSSVKLGIGVAKSSDKKRVVLVARYTPQGNIACPGGKMKPGEVQPIMCEESTVCDGQKLRDPLKEDGQCNSLAGTPDPAGTPSNCPRGGTTLLTSKASQFSRSLAFAFFAVLIGLMLNRGAVTV